MDDHPPPKKKSRFFSNGKSKIGNILHPFKKNSQRDDHDPNEDDSSEADNGPPLLPDIPPLASLTGPAHSAQSLTTTTSYASRPLDSLLDATPRFQPSHRVNPHYRSDGLKQCRRQNLPPQPRDPVSEAEQSWNQVRQRMTLNMLRATRKMRNQGTENTTRPKRREAIYGVESLLPSGSNSNGQATQGSNSMYTPRRAHGPSGNTYTFDGVPTNPYATAAGGQYPFNFSAAQGLPVPPTMQQPAYTS